MTVFKDSLKQKCNNSTVICKNSAPKNLTVARTLGFNFRSPYFSHSPAY